MITPFVITTCLQKHLYKCRHDNIEAKIKNLNSTHTLKTFLQEATNLRVNFSSVISPTIKQNRFKALEYILLTIYPCSSHLSLSLTRHLSRE